MKIELRNVSKSFGTFTALNDVSLTIPSGRLVALLGPSGSGKTTLLRIIAGLEVPGSGAVRFGNEDATGLKAQDRCVGFVFQHYALFRHMSVFENVAFGLRVKPKKLRPTEAEIKARVHELLQLVQLDWLADRRPAQLSGGQRQRVALARALAVRPQVLLLDEPFGSLDAKVRQELRSWLRRLHDEIHITSVFVTHDQEEALEVADVVVVMNKGRIAQIGTPEEIYHCPASSFVCNFLGNVNLFHGRIEGGIAHIGYEGAELSRSGAQAPQNALVYVRPHQLEISLRHGRNLLPATVKHINAAGPMVKVELLTERGHSVRVDMSQERFAHLELKRDSAVFITAKDVRVFPEETVGDGAYI